MAKENIEKLKGYFKAGSIPTEKQFENLIESTINFKDHNVSISEDHKRTLIVENFSVKKDSSIKGDFTANKNVNLGTNAASLLDFKGQLKVNDSNLVEGFNKDDMQARETVVPTESSVKSYISAVESTLDQKLTTLDGIVADNKSKVANHSGRLSNMESNLTTVENNLGTAQGEITSIENRVSNNESAVAKNINDISDLDNKIGSVIIPDLKDVPDPVAAKDAANKKYVDEKVEGHSNPNAASTGYVDQKYNEVKLIADGNKAYIDSKVALLEAGIKFTEDVVAVCETVKTPGNLKGLKTVDKVQLKDKDRVLVINQNDASKNLVYEAGEGAWKVAKDFDGSSTDQKSVGVSVEVLNGEKYKATFWTICKNESDKISWKQRNDLSYKQGDGIIIDGQTISVNKTWMEENPTMVSGAGITINSNEISVDTTWLNQQSKITISGNGLVLDGNTLRLDETWLDNRIRQIMNESNPSPAPTPSVAPKPEAESSSASEQNLSAITSSPAIVLKHSKLTAKPSLSHREDTPGNAVYSLNKYRKSEQDIVAYVDSNSNNIKLFDLNKKALEKEIKLTNRPNHLEYSYEKDRLFFNASGKIYQLDDSDNASEFLTNVDDFFFINAGAKCVVRKGNTLRVVDSEKKTVLNEFQISVKGRFYKNTIAASYMGQFIAVSGGYENKYAEVFNLENGKSHVCHFPDAVCTYSPVPSDNGKELYVGGGYGDGHLYVADILSGKVTRKFKLFSSYLYEVNACHDPNYLIVGGYNGTVKIINVTDGSQYWASKRIGHVNEINTSIDLKRIYVASGAGDASFSVIELK